MISLQFPDSQTYVKVVTKLHVLQPLEVGVAGVRMCVQVVMATGYNAKHCM